MRVNLANYSRRELGTDTNVNGGVRFLSLNRTETMDALFEAFRNGRAELQRNARQLGGRVRDGFGDYYRQVMAPKRQLEQDAQGNWISRYDEHGWRASPTTTPTPKTTACRRCSLLAAFACLLARTPHRRAEGSGRRRLL